MQGWPAEEPPTLAYAEWREAQRGVGSETDARRPEKEGRVTFIDEIPHAVPPLPDSLVAPSRWRLVVRGGWRSAAHICEKEGRVALLAFSALHQTLLATALVFSLSLTHVPRSF